MTVISGALTVLFVILICLMGLKMFATAFGLQFNFLRGGIIAKAAKRFRKGVAVFAVAITVIALLTAYVAPGLGNTIVAAADGISASAQAIGNGAAAGASGTWQAVPILVGIVLALAYWTFVSVKWIAKAKSKDGRMLRQVGAFAVFMPLMIGYLALCFA